MVLPVVVLRAWSRCAWNGWSRWAAAGWAASCQASTSLGSRPDQVQVGVGDVGAGEQERQPVPAAGGAGGCPGGDEQGPGLQVQGGLFAGFAFGGCG